MSLTFLSGEFAQIAFAVNSGDEAPNAEALAVFSDAQATLASTMAKWNAMTTKDLPAINA